jgi:hypothetical protein
MRYQTALNSETNKLVQEWDELAAEVIYQPSHPVYRLPALPLSYRTQTKVHLLVPVGFEPTTLGISSGDEAELLITARISSPRCRDPTMLQVRSLHLNCLSPYAICSSG